MDQLEATPSPPSRAVKLAAMIFMAVFLAAFGGVLCWMGGKGIRDQHLSFTSTVTRSASLGPLGGAESGRFTTIYDGGDAVVAGAGVFAFGLLLITWAVGMVVVGEKPSGARPGPLLLASALLGSAGVILMMPPWQIFQDLGVLVFWLTVAVWGGVFGFVFPRPATPAMATGGKLLFVLTIATAFVLPADSGFAAIFGFLAALGGFAHAVYIHPRWRARAIAREVQADATASRAPEPTTSG